MTNLPENKFFTDSLISAALTQVRLGCLRLIFSEGLGGVGGQFNHPNPPIIFQEELPNINTNLYNC